MACKTCESFFKKAESNKDLPEGAHNIFSTDDAVKIPASILKPGKYSDDVIEKAKKFNNLSNKETLKEHIIDGVNVVPPVLVPDKSANLIKKRPSKDDLPSLREMAFGLTDALKQNITNVVVNGVLLASQEEMEKRFNLCVACEYLIPEQSRCIKCGCYMNMKTRLQASKCPINKW